MIQDGSIIHTVDVEDSPTVIGDDRMIGRPPWLYAIRISMNRCDLCRRTPF